MVKGIKVVIIELGKSMFLVCFDICHIGVKRKLNFLSVNYEEGMIFRRVQLDHISNSMRNLIKHLSLI